MDGCKKVMDRVRKELSATRGEQRRTKKRLSELKHLNMLKMFCCSGGCCCGALRGPLFNFFSLSLFQLLSRVVDNEKMMEPLSENLLPQPMKRK